jgi:hypothetical protein
LGLQRAGIVPARTVSEEIHSIDSIPLSNFNRHKSENHIAASEYFRGAAMIGNALLLALVLFMVFGFLLMDRLKFLIPYRQVIFHEYAWGIALYALALFGNLFATFFLLARRFFLKHTGQKLVYVDKQLRIGEDDLSSEIRERSEEQP